MANQLTRRTGQLFANLKRTVDPTVPAVTVESAKEQLQIEHDDDDSLIRRYIQVATDAVENDSRRGFINQTWQLSQEDFDEDLILLRRCPVSSVTSVTYTDSDGNGQTASSSVYQVDTTSEPGRLYPAYNQTWPTVRADQLNGVQVAFVVGYGADHTSVPPLATQAILLLVHHYWAIRCPVVDAKMAPVPMGYESLIDRLRWD